MSIFDKVTKAEQTNAHGEMMFTKIEGELPADGWGPFYDMTKDGAGYIIGHSESGHHHILEREGVKIDQRTEGGFNILRAIVETPAELKQDAAAPHDTQIVQPGTYIITKSREKPFFQDQARHSAD